MAKIEIAEIPSDGIIKQFLNKFKGRNNKEDKLIFKK